MADSPPPPTTPRASTGQYLSFVGRAEDYAQRLRGLAQATDDVEWSKVLRDMSDTASSYARLFRRWSTPGVVASASKFHEHDGFRLFAAHADHELSRELPRPEKPPAW